MHTKIHTHAHTHTKVGKKERKTGGVKREKEEKWKTKKEGGKKNREEGECV